MRQGFAVWITGLPASGKSTLAAALSAELSGLGVNFTVLESDALRRVLTPEPRYDDSERDVFYGAMLHIGQLLVRHGVSVIFDATANRRAYREKTRLEIPRFLEVYVDCPLPVCESRDPKGIYRRGRNVSSANVPGIQAVYEPPRNPEIVVRGDREPPGDAARRVVAALLEKGYLAD